MRGALPLDVVTGCQDVLWSDLSAHGIARDDRSTWMRPVVRLPCPEGGPFVAAGTGTIPARFPSEADPGDAGWHIDGSFPGPDGAYWVNVRSKQRGLVCAEGRAGDAFLCHPFLVHAASWPHRGEQPRMIAQPGVAILEPFALDDGAAGTDVCPVEAAILRGLRDPRPRH